MKHPTTDRQIVIVVSTIFQNGGDATRALEIAKTILAYQPKDCNLRILFLTHGSLYEKRIKEAGFELYRIAPPLRGIRYQDDFQSRFGELIGKKSLASAMLEGEIGALLSIRPDLLIHGFWPIASIAKRLSMPKLKSIAFLPLPLTDTFLHESLTFPDESFLSCLPTSFQRKLIALLPSFLQKRNPALRHSIIQKAAEDAGWNGDPLINVFKMLKADSVLVNDLPVFYQSECYPSHFIFTGPVYAQEQKRSIQDPEILRILDSGNHRKKIFCSLGTSGGKQELLEVVRMFNSPLGMEYSGILLSPPSVCPIEEIRPLLHNPNIYITKDFVPAKQINEKVNLVICHGGQGTLQTAIMSGTPLIGVATQPEQKINLEHLESMGAAIRIPQRTWNYRYIGRKVEQIFRQYNVYQAHAETLCRAYSQMNTRHIIGTHIWKQLGYSESDLSTIL